MSESSVVAIYLHREKAGAMERVDRVQADAGGGLVGDRYYQSPGRSDDEGADREVTLIELEALEGLETEHGIALGDGESRRNIVTKGVALNPLVGREFRVGETLLRGIRPCHPCRHLESLTQPGVLGGLTNRGGLRAQVLEGGTIRVGDRIAASET